MRRAAAVLVVLALALVGECASAGAVGVLQVQSGGYGHGIGMSQYGADGYALHGKSYGFILAHYYTGTRLGFTDPEQPIRVLLKSGGEPTFSGAILADNTVPLQPGTSYTVKPTSSGELELTRRGLKDHRHVTLTLGPFTGALSVTGAGPVSLAGAGSYHGWLVFRPAGGANVQTINSLPLDEYVQGVVPSEIPSNWPAQALEAQAVAARTYAITSHAGSDFDVFDDTRSQEYLGAGAETAATDNAVIATSGQIVTYRGAPAVTYFFSSSGGYTESIQNEWPGSAPKPWLVGVPDPYDSANGTDPYHRVVKTMSLAAASARLSGLFRGSLLGIDVLRHGLSPRVITASVVGTGGGSLVSGATLQKRFGLPTNWEVFTALSADAGAAPGGNGGTAADEATAAARAARQGAYGVGAQTGAVRALVPLVDSMLVKAIPGLHGQVLPPPPGGGRVAVQLLEHGVWRTVSSVGLYSDGSYDLALPGRGVYRVRYRHLLSPHVVVGLGDG